MLKQTEAHKSRIIPRKFVADSPTAKRVLFRGQVLRVSAGVQARYLSKIMAAVHEMTSSVIRDVEAHFKSSDVHSHMSDVGMDAGAGSQTRILTNKFKDKFDSIFADLSNFLAKQMIEQLNDNSAQQINASLGGLDLLEAGKHLMLDPNTLSPAVKEMLKAATAQSANFIKSIPDRYINQVNNAVLDSIQTGNGLEDLIPQLEKYGNQTANWAHNTAMDQTRKTFNSLNISRMKAVGVTRGEWIHSGGSQKPRPLHVDFDGKPFNLSEGAPVGDDGGDMVQPGEEPNCRCTFTPIVEASADEDTTES
jgi:SPP1 gp7 family putative phage head morphogenesis protein